MKHNLTLSPNKCSFHKDSVNYLGFHIENHAVSPIESNIIKINSFPKPTTKRQLKKFIGLATFYRNLIPAFSKLMQPLIQLTTPKAKYEWTNKHDEIFENVQKIFFSEPMVRLPDWNKKFYLNTDASQTAIAGVLLQNFGSQLLPVAYFSKSLSQSEKNYPALKLELLAIYKSVIAFKYYLYNRNFTILSDSAPLKKYKRTNNPADLCTRWLMELSEYSYDFHHIPGTSNVLADFFSRNDFKKNQQSLETNPELLYEKEQILPIVDNSDDKGESKSKQYVNYLVQNNSKKSDPLLEISNKTFVTEQQKDPEIKVIYQDIKQKGPSEKLYNYFIHPDTKVLMFKRENVFDRSTLFTIVVPQTLKAKCLAITHLSHFGFRKTYEFLSLRYFWKGMYIDTLNFVSSCTKCLQFKHHRVLPAPLQTTYTPKYPGHTIAIDLVGPFSNGQSVLTITDHFSRHMELVPLKDTSTHKIAEALFKYFATLGRTPVILSDLGPQFTSHLYKIFNETLGIKIIHSSSGHPQSNSIAERINTSIKYSVNILMSEGRSFEHALLVHKCLYNGSKHSTTGFSPNLLHFGRELPLIFDTYDQSFNKPFLNCAEQYKFMKNIDHLYSVAYQNIKTTQAGRNIRFGQRAKLRPLLVNDIVYLKSRDKFKPKYTGPYQIIQKHSLVAFTIQKLSNPHARSFRVHIDRLLLAPPRSSHLIDSHNQATQSYDNEFRNFNGNQVSHKYNLRKRN